MSDLNSINQELAAVEKLLESSDNIIGSVETEWNSLRQKVADIMEQEKTRTAELAALTEKLTSGVPNADATKLSAQITDLDQKLAGLRTERESSLANFANLAKRVTMVKNRLGEQMTKIGALRASQPTGSVAAMDTRTAAKRPRESNSVSEADKRPRDAGAMETEPRLSIPEIAQVIEPDVGMQEDAQLVTPEPATAPMQLSGGKVKRRKARK